MRKCPKQYIYNVRRERFIYGNSFRFSKLNQRFIAAGVYIEFISALILIFKARPHVTLSAYHKAFIIFSFFTDICIRIHLTRTIFGIPFLPSGDGFASIHLDTLYFYEQPKRRSITCFCRPQISSRG